MGIRVEEVAVGKCYVTAMRQVRKVLEMDGGRLRYGSRGHTVTPNWEEECWVWVETQKFADDVEHAVACDWDPDYSSDTR